MALLFPSAQLMQIGNLIQFPGSNFTGFNQDSGLDAFGTHTSGHTIAGDSLCPYDRSDDGGSKPEIREALRFASIVPHNLPCRSGSQDVSARVSSAFEDFFN